MNAKIHKLKARKRMNPDQSGTALTLGLLLALQAVAGPGMAYAVAGSSPSGSSVPAGHEDLEPMGAFVQAQTLRGHRNTVSSAAFSPDGRRVVTASVDNTARIWDVASGRELATLSGHKNIVTSAAFSPDGRMVVTASHETTAKIWKLEGSAQP